MANVEKIKKESNYLRGTLREGLANQITGSLTKEDQVVLKFHGSYQQDDRDARERRAQKKLERLYSFMLRLRIAGGVISARDWVAIDEIADKYANEVVKITTRQTVQLHGVVKADLKPVIAGLYREIGVDSIAACGDVNRNVMVSAVASKNAAFDEVLAVGRQISEHLLPKTNAYHEIWLDGKKVEGDEEPLYGEVYLPRKFKIAMAIPPHNDVDVYAHDIGLVAVIEGGELRGFNVIVGGGMGRTHGNEKTFARSGDLVGFVEKGKILDAVFQIAAIQRDFGNRQERALSRFKYTIAKHGLDWFLTKFERYFGEKMLPARDFSFEKRGDVFGWAEDYHGRWNFTVFVENGRLFGEKRRAISEIARGDLAGFRFTNNQNVMIEGVLPENKAKVEEILRKNGILDEQNRPIRLDAIACVALNTCSLALAEGQRYLPSLITKIEGILAEFGLEEEGISIRMTGCPNGCGRPYLAEFGLVGKALGVYDLHLGGDVLGERLNQIYKENLDEEGILAELSGLFGEFSRERGSGELFGDWFFKKNEKK